MAVDTAGLIRLIARVRPYVGRVVAVVLAVALLVFVGPRLLLGPVIAVEPVVQRDFVQTVVATGRVEAPHRIEVGVQITGTVGRIPVEEGQRVDKGTVLIELESSELSAALAQALRGAEQARARLRQLREVQAPLAEQTLRQARANHDNAVQTLQRNRQLLAQGFVAQSTVDDAVRAEAVAQAQLRAAEEQLATTGPSGSDMALALANVKEAESAADMARARLAYAVVAAPAPGVLIARSVERGDVVAPGKALMVLSPDGDTQLVVNIDEKNIGLLQLGQDALASADAFPDQSFPARLVYINPGVNAQTGAVEVKLAVPAPPAYLKQDMTVSVDIAVARRAQARLLAATALHDVDSASPWVYRVEGRHVRRQAVKLGLHGKGLYEVRDGLKTGDLVVNDASSGLSDGARIRPDIRASRP